MPLVYFVDANLDPVPGGNAYATEPKLSPLLAFHPKWSILTIQEREDKIIEATAQLDSLDYKGRVYDTAQPLQFPRAMTSDTEGEFTREAQVRRLFRAVAQQVEYNLNRVGIGMVNYGHGGESFTQRQDIICREAEMTIAIYEK